MHSKIINKIIKKIGDKNILKNLSNNISTSELNSLMLEIFKHKANERTPSELLQYYTNNRFVKPSEISPLELLKLELNILKISQFFQFEPIELSPVVPLGTCSVISEVDQNNIISALRGCEVLADATNSLALYICNLKKQNYVKGYCADMMKFCAIHRHVRAQKYNNPKSLSHFLLFCMVSASKDRGSYLFETKSMVDHIKVYKTLIKHYLPYKNIKCKFIEYGGYTDSSGLISKLKRQFVENFNSEIILFDKYNMSKNNYYKGVQFKIYINHNQSDIEVGDGGFVDWSQKILQNKKERMLISGIGIERLMRIINEKNGV